MLRYSSSNLFLISPLHSQPGLEANLVRICFGKIEGNPEKYARILAVFERSTVVLGSIYVEALSQTDVLDLVTSIYGVYSGRGLESVPMEDRPALLRLGRPAVTPGAWVRISGRGRYRNDLGNVVGVDPIAQTANVVVVPRGSLESMGKGKVRQGKGNCRIRPPARLCHPERSGRDFEQLDDLKFKFNGNIFIDGLMLLKSPIRMLRSAFPSMAELEVFGRSSALDATLVFRTWSECAATTLIPGDRVRIVKGEQAGLTGKITSILNDIITFSPESKPDSQIEVSLTSVRSHFCTGDNVEVKIGLNFGKFGAVIGVERKPETDMVTFIDDASIKAGSPELVSSPILEITMSSALLFYTDRCVRVLCQDLRPTARIRLLPSESIRSDIGIWTI